ncbi:MAG: metallophosphoesterase family protein [Elusimicrobia bacterium]|nr:metallophosphoesterase family protein [Elusimicrobiota bacterium]
MFMQKCLTNLFRAASAEPVMFDDSSKFIIFSDCHRGDGGWTDNFADNQNTFFHALDHYYSNGFTYIELGDGDELFENKKFADIRQAYSHIFWLMKNFHEQKRLYLIFGNHDKERQCPSKTEKTLFGYFDKREESYKPLFDGIIVREMLVLQHSKTGKKLFLVHGHQGDLINDYLWKVGRFFVRYIWRNLQLFGFKDPTSPAKVFRKCLRVEKSLIKWSKDNNQTIITGHTHRPRFPHKDKVQYFNSGSCVHPRCITGLEIENGEITLVKWSVKNEKDGVLKIKREILEGSEKI